MNIQNRFSFSNEETAKSVKPKTPSATTAPNDHVFKDSPADAGTVNFECQFVPI